MSDDLTRRVVSLLAPYTETPESEIGPEATFEDLGLDSLDSLSLVGDFEEAFDLSISNDEAYAITSVQEAVDVLRARIERRAAAEGA